MAGEVYDDTYRETVRALSDRLVEAQRPIRVLDSIKWGDAIEDGFFAADAKAQPAVDRGYYQDRPIGFDPEAKLEELHRLERDVNRQLGQFSPVGVIMRRMCEEYSDVVRMLTARGTAEFSRLSKTLYGSASDVFHAGDPTLADLGVMMSEALANIDESGGDVPEPKIFSGAEAVEILQERLNRVFTDPADRVDVRLSDGIVADAAAGADYLKIREDARFNDRDLRLLEIHEGWVHVGTTMNGKAQPVCTFLSKGPPSSTITQEGLAILMEVICFASHPDRLRRLTNRVRATHMAEDGATFLDVYRFFLENLGEEREAYAASARVFRGSTPTGQPFTKDLTYAKGFVLVYNYVQLAVKHGLLDRIPLLFCGKTTLEDMRTLAQLVEDEIVVPPKHLPPQVRDMKALAAWMCFSNFLNRLSLERIELDYANIL